MTKVGKVQRFRKPANSVGSSLATLKDLSTVPQALGSSRLIASAGPISVASGVHTSDERDSLSPTMSPSLMEDRTDDTSSERGHFNTGMVSAEAGDTADIAGHPYQAYPAHSAGAGSPGAEPVTQTYTPTTFKQDWQQLDDLNLEDAQLEDERVRLCERYSTNLFGATVQEVDKAYLRIKVGKNAAKYNSQKQIYNDAVVWLKNQENYHNILTDGKESIWSDAVANLPTKDQLTQEWFAGIAGTVARDVWGTN